MMMAVAIKDASFMTPLAKYWLGYVYFLVKMLHGRSPRPTFYHYCPDDAMQHVFVLFCCSTTKRKEEVQLKKKKHNNNKEATPPLSSANSVV